MSLPDVIRQTMRRAGAGHARRRAEWGARVPDDWRAVEKPERIVRRLEQLGMRQEARTVAAALLSGAPLDGFNPLERIIGQNQLMSSFFLPLGARRARAVGRIVTKNGGGFGTGFLISPRLLMTNNHVLRHERAANHNRVEFDYVRRFDGGIGRTQIFRLLPVEFFVTSEARGDLNLDYTVVAVEAVNAQGEALAGRGFIPLAASGGVLVGELTNIIQHPGGAPQQVALRDSKVVKALDHFIHYEADTLPGSSGSPVFNDQWQLAALHHSGVPEEVRPGVYRLLDGGVWDPRATADPVRQVQMSGRVNWLSNEGVLISSIVADVGERLRGDPARLALFEDAAREEASPPPERDEAGPRVEVGRPEATPFPDWAVPQVVGGAVTWNIPLRVTVQLGPDPHLSLSGGPSPHPLGPPAPDQTAPPPSHSDNSAPPRHPGTFDPAVAVTRLRERLEGHPDVLEVRDGFLWRDGFMTERRAAVVVLDPGGAAASGDPYETLGVAREVEGLPVDVTLGGPAALLRARARKGRPSAEALTPADPFPERAPRITYRKPEGLSLEEVAEPMEVICHASPDDGWPVLSDFLSRVEKTLTLGSHDLSAPHVVSKIRELAAGNADFRFNLCLQRGHAGDLAGVEKNDLQEADVIEGLRQLMGDRFRQAYANVSGDERTFASSYHLKAAVRDGEELWLSSGDLRSSSQPPPDVLPAADYEQNFAPLRHYNRAWHVVVKSRALARTFEAYLLHDLEAAEANPAGPPAPEPFVAAARPAPETDSPTDSLAEYAPPRYFARKVIPADADAPVTVRPLLTPDDYLGPVIELVRSAGSRLFIQNQSLALLDPPERNEASFNELWQAIKSRQDAGVDVRMIFRLHPDEDEARAVKDRLVKSGFTPGSIRAQEGCLVKGVVIDSQIVMLGSHNWTNQGTTADRDASLIFRHPEVARYYEQIFLFDWDRLARDPRPARPAF